jgi:hypothetical protein
MCDDLSVKVRETVFRETRVVKAQKRCIQKI